MNKLKLNKDTDKDSVVDNDFVLIEEDDNKPKNRLIDLSKDKLINIILRKDDEYNDLHNNFKNISKLNEEYKEGLNNYITITKNLRYDYEELCDKTASIIVEKNRKIRKQQKVIDSLIISTSVFIIAMIIMLLV